MAHVTKGEKVPVSVVGETFKNRSPISSYQAKERKIRLEFRSKGTVSESPENTNGKMYRNKIIPHPLGS